MINPAEQIGAVTRELQTVQRDGQEMTRLIAARDYKAAVDDVWNALTDPERIPRWFLPISGDLQVGGRYQFEGNAGGKVLACKAPRELNVTWEMGEQVSFLDLTLDQDGDRTRLTLTHDAAVDPGMWKQYGPGAVGVGWEGGLMGLALHLASGQTLDPAAFQEWSVSPEGIAFNTGASEAWGKASVAFGTDPEEAKAAVGNCTAFYTVVSSES